MTDAPRARRVLVCEDSKPYAAALTRFLEEDDQIEVVGVVASGELAIAEVERLQPDLLTLDVQLPGMDGLDVVRRLMAESPLPIVILSGTVAKGSGRAIEALAAGALEVLPKDRLRLDRLDDMWAQAMRSRLRRLSSVRVGRGAAASKRLAARGPHSDVLAARRMRAVGIGASTGGPPVLEAILGGLAADHPVPVLVVQHMADGFVEGFARWLDRKLPVGVRLAADGDPVAPGVWFAPDGAHLLVDRSERFVLAGEPETPHRPSVDVMLESLARAFGAEAAGVVLTGMGKDGAAGTAAIRREGGLVLAQDEASSVIYGMPRAAAEAGADLVLSPAEIADALSRLRPGGRR